jgi:hypothetical protein
LPTWLTISAFQIFVMSKPASNSSVQPCSPWLPPGTVMLPVKPDPQSLLTV